MNETFYIVKKYRNLPLGKYFNSSEFSCPCSSCLETKINAHLVEKLNAVREAFGFPIRITSGYRCPDYQEGLKARGYETAVGVSQHELGNAVDLQPAANASGVSIGMENLRKILENYFAAIGEGRTFFHVDMRDDKTRRWSYNKR